jgi:hypothetical protein
MALVSALVGIGVGALFFPRPDFSPWNSLPWAGDLLVSFSAPILVSLLLSLGAVQLQAWRGRTQVFDFGRLARSITSYD